MIDHWLLTAAPCPSATFLLDRAQISSPRFSDQLASLDQGSRAIVLDRRKARVLVVGRDGQEISDVFALAARWGWVRGDAAGA